MKKKLDVQFIMLMKNWMKVKLYLENFFHKKKRTQLILLKQKHTIWNIEHIQRLFIKP